MEIQHESIFKKGALEGYFGAKADVANQRVYLYFNGYFDMSCAEVFFKEYTEAKAAVTVSKADLFVLAKNLKPFPQESLASAGEVYKDYTNFKSITFVEPENKIASMQVHRVLREQNIEDKYKFVADI